MKLRRDQRRLISFDSKDFFINGEKFFTGFMAYMPHIEN
jgi:hypothetical protein